MATNMKANQKKTICHVAIGVVCFFALIRWLFSNREIPLETKRKNLLSRPRINSTNLLIFAYMRSGSTLTGEMLAQEKSTFYTFEPLMPLAPYHYFTNTKLCKMRDSTCRDYESDSDAAERYKVAKYTLLNLYSCRIKNLSKDVLYNILKEGKSGTAWSFLKICLDKNIKYRQRCFIDIENACRTASIRLTKVLRMDFNMAAWLIREISNLKVLYLSRDPRGIINSRLTTDWFPIYVNDTKTVQDNIENLCGKMEDDFNVYQSFRKQDGDQMFHRILFTTFERIALTNSNTLYEIFKFVDDQVTIKEVHQLLTSYKNNLAPYKWKTDLQSPFKRAVDKTCENVLSQLKQYI